MAACVVSRRPSTLMLNILWNCSSGNIWAWGDNRHGELGIGRQHVKSSVPVRLDFPLGSKMRITHIAAGALHSLAIDAGGNLWAWGTNTSSAANAPSLSGRHLPHGDDRRRRRAQLGRGCKWQRLGMGFQW
jgi:alpha-tubulin suppressor-like RCC1 family protein